jgi:hypothetical protein
MNSFRDAILKWPSLHELAADMGVGITTAQSWLYRDSIPNTRWPRLIEKAKARGIRGVSPTALCRLIPGEKAKDRVKDPEERERVAS